MPVNSTKKSAFKSFCLHLLLPVLSLFLSYYLLTLLNGTNIDPSFRSTLTKVIAVGFLLLIYWIIKGAITFFREIPNDLKATKIIVSEKIVNQGLTPDSQKKSNGKQEPHTKSFNWLLILPGFIILLLSLFNPSYQDFKEYSPEGKTQGHYAQWKRVSNYLIFSVYEKDIYEREDLEEEFSLTSSQKYIGFVLNFLPLH